ncbi:MAG: glycosyl transferase, partial [Actinobacteria bacterium]|nr:glycosyl transferase [Actinomycetota bacterium]
MAPGAVVTLLAAFVVPGIPVWPWIGLVIATMAFPALLPLLERMIPRRTTTPGAVRFSRFSGDLIRIGERLVLQTAFLAHQAQLAANAIFVTLWRLVVSRRGLLTWLSAEEAERRSDLSLPGFIHRMGTAGLVGLIVAAGAAFLRPETLPVALAWAGLWVLSPVIAYAASLPRAPILLPTLALAEIQSMRIIGRRTWRFFETYVTAEENWLPPDNFQEDPADLAHRTSPTNIGLYLLSVLVAREFGWIGRVEMVERLENTLATINRLEQHEGHLFNWYDTTSSQPLSPRYVSSVDSGNLAGHLLTIAQGCLRESGRKSGSEVASGIRDTILLFKEAAGGLLGAHSMIEVVSAADLDRAVEEMEELVDSLGRGERNETAVLRSMREVALTVQDIAQTAAAGGLGHEVSQLADTLMRTVGSHLRDAESDAASNLEDRLSRLATSAASFANMDFAFLLDPANKLLAVGYSMSESALDGSHYDLLASEARLASFIGIAQGDLPPAHWFHLGRPMTPLGTEAALISWSGSMFEYLMPYLVMRTPPGSVLDATYRAVVRRQIEYGRSRSIPWGISESAFAARDTRLIYQYSAFGVPGLGFERGLSEDLVVAPYATVLAAMVDPKAAFDNLEELAGLGALGRFGFYESIDFTTTRVPDDGQPVLVKAFMAHHQGMTLVALANVLFAGLIRDLFHSEPLVMATELLLHEQIPRDVEVARPRAEEVAASTRLQQRSETVVRRFSSPHTRLPVTHLLSNGRYSVMITGAGSGYSQLGRQSVTRWREDATSDEFGSYIYIKDESSGRSWSAGYQPRRVEASQYTVLLSEDHAEISRRDGVVETTLQVVVSAEDDAEVRRLTLTNLGAVELELE